MARNILFTYVPNLDVSSFIDEHLGNTTDTYSKRIAFLGETGLIMTRGEIFAASKLSENYEMSKLLNSSLRLQPDDSMETAFGKLEKAIIDNEETITNAFIYYNNTKIDASEISTVGLTNDYNDLDNIPEISLALSSSYVMSPSTNEDLFLQPNDSFETAFSKLEKAIIDNEYTYTNAFIYLDENKLNSSEISTVGLTNDYNDLDNLPVIPSVEGFATEEYVDNSINILKDYVDSSLVLSSSYVMSPSTNEDLFLQPNDRFETAFSKLEKAIIDNEESITNAFIYIDENKLNSSEISTVGLTNDYNDLDNLPVIPSVDGFATVEYVDGSINILKDYVDSSLVLSSSYVMSSSLNDDLYLQPNDRFETAFGKLEKAIIDNEEVALNEFININDRLIDVESGISSYINNVNYSSNDRTITFYHNNSSISVIDANDFIKDGMLNDVSIDTPESGPHAGENCLILIFNTDAGQEPIEIPITDIFDPILSPSYVMSASTNADLLLAPGDTYEKAFGKLEKAIIDNEYTIANAFININDTKIDASEISTVGLSNDYNDLDNLPTLSDFVTKEYVDTSINLLSETLTTLINDISDNIIKEIENDEEVIVNKFINVDASINELKDSLSSLDDIIDLINDVSDNIINELEKDELVIVNRFINVDASINELKDSLSSLDDIIDLINDVSDNIIKEIEDDEEVIATALTTLNTSINLLSSLNTDIDDLKNDTSTLSYIIERLNNLGKIVNVETLTSAMTIDAYKIYKLGTVDQTVTISFDTTTEISGYSADYTIIFTADTSCSIILPNTCLYANNITPVYVTGRTYEINISNNLVVVTSFY